MKSTNKEEMYFALRLELIEAQIELADLYIEIRSSKLPLGGPELQARRLEIEGKLESLNRKSLNLDESFEE